VDFIVGTFSKSLGGVGGFCVSRHREFDLLRLGSRPYIFTASPPPPVIAAARAALSRLLRGDDLRAQLWRNIGRFNSAVTRLGYRVGSKDPGPVTALVFGERSEAIAHWQGLLDAGIYTNLMVPPATPAGLFIVRISLSAAHTDAQITRMIEAFEGLSQRLRTAAA
jgi:8-amino-7-oxononanoate synthase